MQQHLQRVRAAEAAGVAAARRQAHLHSDKEGRQRVWTWSSVCGQRGLPLGAAPACWIDQMASRHKAMPPDAEHTRMIGRPINTFIGKAQQYNPQPTMRLTASASSAGGSAGSEATLLRSCRSSLQQVMSAALGGRAGIAQHAKTASVPLPHSAVGRQPMHGRGSTRLRPPLLTSRRHKTQQRAP